MAIIVPVVLLWLAPAFLLLAQRWSTYLLIGLPLLALITGLTWLLSRPLYEMGSMQGLVLPAWVTLLGFGLTRALKLRFDPDE